MLTNCFLLSTRVVFLVLVLLISAANRVADAQTTTSATAANPVAAKPVKKSKLKTKSDQANPATPQAPAPAPTKTEAAPSKSSKQIQTNPLPAIATVKDSVVVEAGLLTPDSAKDLFGGWVSDHFAVVQVTIGNQSREQQFVLQDIFFDYSNWALSGLYANAGVTATSRAGLQDYQKGTSPGQISSIGALEVHDGMKSYSVFSKRNLVVNGLVLAGTAAGGFAFLGPTGFVQASGAFSSQVIPGLQKFWPDRSIDQQSNILKYGYQDKLVIAKEDPGKTYAFFPIARFLTSGLAQLYKKEPALFINPAELLFDPRFVGVTDTDCGGLKSSECKAVRPLKSLVFTMLSSALPGAYGKIAWDGNKPTDAQVEQMKLRVLEDLVSPCYYGQLNDQNKNGEADCDLSPNSSNGSVQSYHDKLEEIRAVKHVMAVASLNSVRIVVSGIMTVDVETIPATLSSVTFDRESDGEKLWNDLNHDETGVIKGKFLLNGKPSISKMKLSSGESVKPGDYFDATSFAAVSDTSNDSELHFKVQFKKPIPNGSILTFQVIKSSSKGVNSGDGSANTTETTSSMTLDYPVSFTPTAPTLSGVKFNNETFAAWQKTGTEISGVMTGTNLTDAKPSATAIKLADTTTPAVSDYIAAGDVVPVAKGSDATTLNFTIKLKKAIPAGATLTFETATVDKDGKDVASGTQDHIIPADDAKLSSQPTPTHAGRSPNTSGKGLAPYGKPGSSPTGSKPKP